MRRTRLRRESVKHRERRLSYEVKKVVWLRKHPNCQFEFHDCYDTPIGVLCNSPFMCDLHHKMGRGKYLDDERFFMTLCREHHDWVECNKREARIRGYILYK